MRYALAAILLAACSSTSGTAPRSLVDAVDRAELSLADSVDVALAETGASGASRARLAVSTDPVFAVGTVDTARDVRVDIVTGAVLANTAATAGEACPDAIPLDEAIAIAESAGGGTAVAIEPDDDVACAREVQVLRADDVLWEIKVGGDGEVLESEVSDENED
jgi:uncharacterized membrane protein YkoI